MKKIILGICIAVVGIIIVGVVIMVGNIGTVIKGAVEKFGPQYTGTDVTLNDVTVKPLKGFASLNGLVVGNPEGFKTDHAIKLGAMELDIDLGSLSGDVVVINRILIDGPALMLELGLKKTNVGALMKNIEKATAGGKAEGEADTPEKDKEPEKESDKPQKKVIIREVVVSNGQVGLSSPVLQGNAVTLPLPTLNLTDIGAKDESGTSFAEATSLLLHEIFESALQVVASSGKLTGDMLMSLGDTGLKLGADIAGKASEGLETLADEGLEGAAKAAEKVVGGLGSVIGGDNAEKGIKKLGKLLGSDSDAPKEE